MRAIHALLNLLWGLFLQLIPSVFHWKQEAEIIVGDKDEKTVRIGADSDDASSYESARDVPFEEKKHGELLN